VGDVEEYWETVEVIDAKMASYMRKSAKRGWDDAVDKYLIYWAKIYGFGEFFLIFPLFFLIFSLFFQYFFTIFSC